MMASARRRAANQDLPRHPSSSLSTLMADNTAGSISMDDLLKNIYSEADPPSIPSPDPHPPLFHTAAGTDEDKGMDEVWEEIVAGHGEGAGRQHPTDGGTDQQMTLEDFLSKAATKHPVEVGGAARAVPGPPFMVSGSLIQPQGGQLGVGGGRGKRRAAVQPPVDKATQQKQRRMIKNRESATRSRERKQAYTIELESLVTQLEEENARLLREETMWYSDEAKLHEENREKLVKVVIPVTEGRRPPRTLHRVHSM